MIRATQEQAAAAAVASRNYINYLENRHYHRKNSFKFGDMTAAAKKAVVSTKGSNGKRVFFGQFSGFSVESFLLLLCLTASLLLLPLILPPLPPPPLMLLLVPICILAVLMMLAFMPCDVRDMTYPYV